MRIHAWLLSAVMGIVALVSCLAQTFPNTSHLIPLCSPILVSTGSSSGTSFTFPNPQGTMVTVGSHPVFVIKVTAAPSGGSGQTLQLDIQHSCDDGQTFSDYATKLITGTGTFYIPVSTVAAPYFSGSAIADDITILPGANYTYQGPIGHRFRVSFNASMGTGTSGPWAFQTFVLR